MRKENHYTRKILPELRGQDGQGESMKRDVSPKPRGIETRPPEELFRILCGIYPLEVAQEIFERLMEEDEKK